MRVLIVFASILVVVAMRVPTRSQYLFSWDSVNFALAIERIDVAAHQPHPPGYFGYVIAARLMRLGGSENTALLRVNTVAAVLTGALIWWFALRLTRSPRCALVGCVILLTSPLHWFYSSVAEIYVVELFVTLAAATCAYECIRQSDDRRWPWLLGAATAIGALCKSPAILLMAPLITYAFVRMSSRAKRATVLALTLGTVGVVITVDSLNPVESLWRLSISQIVDISDSSNLRTLRLRALNRHLRDLLYASIGAVGAGGLASLFFRRRSQPTLPALFVTLWAVPYVLICLLVHFPKPGYALPLLPPVALWIASGFWSTSRANTGVAIVLIVGLNTAQFALSHPWAPDSTGGGRRYADKTRGEKLRTELNSILRPSLATIRHHDSLLASFLDACSRTCNSSDMVLLISSSAPISWRHAMFYLPEAIVIQIPDSRTGLLIAAGHKLQHPSRADVTVRADCTVLAGSHLDNRQFLVATRGRAGEVDVAQHKLLWSRVPFSMQLHDGRTLRVHRNTVDQ